MDENPDLKMEGNATAESFVWITSALSLDSSEFFFAGSVSEIGSDEELPAEAGVFGLHTSDCSSKFDGYGTAAKSFFDSMPFSNTLRDFGRKCATGRIATIIKVASPTACRVAALV